MKIFISSTIYDLLDLRSEAEALLRKVGYLPVLSEKYSSEFEVRPTTDSIELCLVNVKNSDELIIILDKRYGPSLGESWNNISATHLEYNFAKKEKIPIRFFIRDRTEADFNIWRKNNGKLNLNWIEEKDYGIFDIISDRRKLEKGQPNWIYTFRNSQDFKKILFNIYQDRINEDKIKQDIRNDNVSFIDIKMLTHDPEDTDQARFSLIFICHTRTAYDVKISCDLWKEPLETPMMVPGIEKNRALVFSRNQNYATINLEYKSGNGVLVKDNYELRFMGRVYNGSFVRLEMISRNYELLKEENLPKILK